MSVRLGLVLTSVVLMVGSLESPLQPSIPVALTDNESGSPTAMVPRVSPVWPLAWTEDLSIEELEAVMLRTREDHGLGSHLTPTAFPSYALLDDDHKRMVWRMWLVSSAISKDHVAPIGSPAWMHLMSPSEQSVAQAAAKGSGAGDVEEVWRIQTHGFPRSVIPADDQGAYNLVTYYTVLHFDGQSAVPTWLARPGELIIDARGADANKDGITDVVVRVFPLMPGGNTIVVLDGTTGAVLHQFAAGNDELYSWTLTDADKDGVVDVVGLTYAGRVVGMKLDGSPLFNVEPAGLPDVTVPAPVGNLYAYYLPTVGAAFADVNGDAVSDIVVGASMNANFFTSTVAGFARKSVVVGRVVAYDGTSGTEVWTAPYAVGGDYIFPFGLRSGDFDGDGNEDAAMRWTAFDFSYASSAAASISLNQVENGYAVFNGPDGRVLAKDTRGSIYAFSPAPVPLPLPPYGTMAGIPQTLVDSDGDGSSELILTVPTVASGSVGMDIVGLGPGAPGGPAVEEYRIPIRIAEMDSYSARRVERDMDGDKRDDVAFLVTARKTVENKTSFDSRLYAVLDGSIKETDLASAVAFYDFDPINQRAYGLIPSDDRWVPLDSTGTRTAEGARILLQSFFLGAVDARNGTVPNLLLQKTTGAIIIDGKTGKIARELNRPLDTFAVSLRQERGRDVIMERTMSGAVNGLDARDGSVLFSAHPDGETSERFLDAQDANGDGSLDVCFEAGTAFATNHRARIVDPRTSTTLWESDLPSRALYYADLIADRAGYEILTVDRPTVPSAVVALFLPTSEKPLWNASLQGMSFSSHGEGFVVLRKTGADPYLSILDGGSGVELRKVATPSQAALFFPRLLSFSQGTYAALVLSWAQFDSEALLMTTELRVEWLRGMSGNFTVHVAEDKLDEGSGVIFAALPTALEAGDWNADRKPDVAITANQTLMIVSGVDGTRLASAPGYLGVRANIDLEPDGKKEVVVAGSGASVVLLRHMVGAAPLAAPEPVVLQEQPQQALEANAVAKSKKGSVPSIGLIGLGGAVALAVGLRRRF